MKNKEGLLFSILLLLLNAVGASGAFVTTLRFTWGTVLDPVLFFRDVVLLCILAALFWRRSGSHRRLLMRAAVFLTVYGVCIFALREDLLNGLAWGLDEAVSRLNERYNIYLVWNWDRERDALEMTRTATLSVLTALVPYIFLIGYGVMRSRAAAVILADALWFIAACAMDEFPAYGWIVLCVLGLAAVMVKKAYRDDERAGVKAAFFDMAVLAVVMIFVYRFLVPVFDEKYEAVLNARVELYRKINEEWIPQLQKAFSQLGSEGGANVTGELIRETGAAYTSAEVYRVTMDAAPKTAVYLKGFVGKEYSGDEWKADSDSAMEKYYRARGWKLPESGGELVNLTYEAFRSGPPGNIRIQELAGAGRYSLYPYGAEMTEDYKVHWDGSAEWKSNIYEFSYYAPEGSDVTKRLSGVQAEEELHYRSYVYDNFCEYPEELFPKLTEFLEESGFSRDSLYESLADILSWLRSNARYNLEAGNPPAGEDFVEYFLFESREGYCAHFASAAILMLRYLGVPARYATGYSVSADAFSREADGTYTAVITDRQAHAWVEVYLDGAGWIPVEMTPGAAAFVTDNSIEQLVLAGQLAGVFTEDITEPEEAENEDNVSGEPSSVPRQGEEPEAPSDEAKAEQAGEILENASEAPEDIAGGKHGQGAEKSFELSPGVKAVMKVTFGAVLFVFICYAAVRLTKRNRYRRLCRADNRERIFLVYQNLKKLLRLSGHSEKLAGGEPDTCDFCQILEKSSFGEKEPTEEELRRVMAFYRRLVTEEYGELPVYKRPLYKCLDIYG